LINKYNDTDGRLILINVEINNTIFTLVCIYAPNCRSSRNSFFKKVTDKIQEHGIGIPIVGGDFNETLKSIDRKTSRSNQNNQPVLHTHFSPILIFLPGKMSIYSVFPPEK
jgi:exonuclease III